ncbi:MAG TPA: penicillin-binding protein 2 [Solirubrobacteraceae bacterium]|nr:penicillin-binding protein 2 [Solirubrobacteraceae bacterium]
MNRSIAKLYVCVLVLFALLFVWTSRWTVFSSSALANNPLNRLGYFATLKVKRGRILAADGHTVLARSVPAGGGTWSRTYPLGPLFAQTVGYNNIQEGQSSGLEQAWVKALENRQQTTLSSVFGPISTSNLGNDVITTLDPQAQGLARSLLAGRVGSVVAIVPQTGAIPVMYSNPTYNDNHPSAPCPTLPNAGQAQALAASCQLNLATQAGFAPGSTFKVVTTAAALNTGRYTPTSLINGHSPLIVSGVPLHNDANEQFGNVTLTEALTLSINTVYAQVGQNVGRATMQEYMHRFGFYAPPPVDLPNVIASGERAPDGRLLEPTSPTVDLGRMSIGQDKLEVTPLQMAMVVAAVADGGRLMRPRLVSKVVNPDGQIVETDAPSVFSNVMSAKAAAEEAVMMQHVVEEGTGQAANLGGLNAAGKTGTATVSGTYNGPELDNAWFVGFAPVQHPRIAVAVVLPRVPNGYGGTYAAPIAAQMMKTLLSEGL